MYRNFKITEEEKKQILESHMSYGYKKPVTEEESLDEFFGRAWLTKIKIDGHYDASDEEKAKITSEMEGVFNGRIAVQFKPGEWFDSNGRIEDIEAYENDLNDKLYGGEEKRAQREKFRDAIDTRYRNTSYDDPHTYRYKDLDHYKQR